MLRDTGRRFRRLLVIVACLAGASVGRSATCVVTSTSDDGTNTGSLRHCVQHAASGDTINFASALNGQTITVASALDIGTNLTIAGPGANLLTISGGSAVQVFTITRTPGSTVTISGLTIEGGKGDWGGGVHNERTLILRDCVFSHNHAYYGGAVYNQGTVTASNCTFSDNAADQDNSEGGGVFNDGGTAVTIIRNCTFSHNTATRGGAAIWSYSVADAVGPVTISGSTFSGNTAGGQGTGIFSGGTLTMSTSILAGDKCVTDGGACPKTGVDGNVVTTASGLTPLGNYGGPMQTMLPLPGNAAICAASLSTPLPADGSTDQRGFPRKNTSYTGYSAGNPCVDAGAVQTNYQSVQFTNVPSGGYYSGSMLNQAISPGPVVSITESSQKLGGVPLTLTFSGNGTAEGLGPSTTVAGTGATFGSLQVDAAGTSDVLTVTVPVVGTYSLSANAGLEVTLTEQNITVTQHAPASAAYNATFQVAATANSTLAVAITAQGSCTVAAGGSGSATIRMTSGSGGCSVFYDQAGNNSYSPASEAADSTTATKATATVTFGKLNPTYTGHPLSPSVTTAPANLSFTLTGAPQTSAGSYSVTATINDANYAGTNSDTFTIQKATATVTFGNLNPTYTGSPLSPSVTTVPANLSYTLTGAPQTNAGAYPVTATINDTNYTGSNSDTFTIKKATATVAFGNLSPTYTGSPLSPSVTTAPANLSYTLTGAPQTNAGAYSVTATINDANYTGSNTGAFVINKATVAVIAANQTRVYGAANPVLTWGYGPFVGSDSAGVVSGSPIVSTSATPASLPGTYPIAVDVSPLSAANYNFTGVPALLTVTFTAGAPASGTTCNGAYSGTFTGSPVVSSGQTCVFAGGGITGNVQVKGGSLVLVQSKVTGNVEAIGGGNVSIGPGSTITGNLQIHNLPANAGQSQVCGSTVNGNLDFVNNNSAVLIGSAATSCAGNQVGGDLTVHNNSGATTVAGNTVTGNLDDHNNTGATQVFNNTVGNNLACQQNSTITGGGNTAKTKQGQCAAF
jgi:hypothetical protein